MMPTNVQKVYDYVIQYGVSVLAAIVIFIIGKIFLLFFEEFPHIKDV